MTSNTLIHDSSLSWLDTDIPIKSGAAKLVYVSKMTTLKLTQELLISKRNRQYKAFYVSYFPTDKEIPFHIKFNDNGFRRVKWYLV
jgi:hypothetical protein